MNAINSCILTLNGKKKQIRSLIQKKQQDFEPYMIYIKNGVITCNIVTAPNTKSKFVVAYITPLANFNVCAIFLLNDFINPFKDAACCALFIFVGKFVVRVSLGEILPLNEIFI